MKLTIEIKEIKDIPLGFEYTSSSYPDSGLFTYININKVRETL